MKRISKKRRNLLVKLESIIGNECYNGNIQNYGPWGEWEGEGREFRYPVTFLNTNRQKVKRKYVPDEVPFEELQTGYYAFGANELHIFRALSKVLQYLEANHGLIIENKKPSQESKK